MTVTVAGRGPAIESLTAVLTEADRAVDRVDPDAIGGELAVVVDTTGARAFETADERARAADLPWFAVEFDGIGGRAIDDVAATVTALGVPCYHCLCDRVAAAESAPATTDEESTGERDDQSVGDDPTLAPAQQRYVGALAGRRVLGRLEGTIPAGAVVEVPHTRRQLVPVPNCRCATRTPDYARDLRADDTDRSLEAALDRAERALDARVGLVTDTGELRSIPLPYYLATLSDTSRFSDARAPGQAAGVDPDWDRAFMKGLGEALERYSAAIYRSAALLADDHDHDHDDEGRRIDRAAFVGPHAPDAPRVPGRDLATGEMVSLPAERVFYPTGVGGITTGLGLGNGGAAALVAGLTEVIERDAAMLAWYSTYDPLGLQVGNDRFRDLRRRAGTADLSVTATLLTQDIDVPVVAVAVHRTDGAWPRFALGSAAAFDPVAAALNAGAEALQNWMELDEMGRSEAADADGAIAHFATLPDAAQPFVTPETTVPADSVADTVPTGPGAVEAAVDRLQGVGLEAYATRLTPRDVDALGFEAVRVLVPGAQPLFMNDAMFGDRARSVPESLGFEPRLQRQHHPFP